MKTNLILSMMLLLGIFMFGVANADSPVVAPELNASVEQAPIVIAGAKRKTKTAGPTISCCNSDGSCQITKQARCTIQGGTPAPGTCSVTPPTLDPVCSAD